MKISQKFSLSVKFASLSLACISCGPIYDTHYTFTPPRSMEGRTCVFQCEQNKLQCQQIEDLEAARCRDYDRVEQRRCRDQIYYSERREPKWYECGSSSCSADYSRCVSMYHACYQSCGGNIKAETLCVSNCDQIGK